ncbi:MAG: heparinase II/III family protein, partial [Armatimonadetes bacterium]|nr:heparinase II/III family protein [Armatimonadota bacterium]
VPFEDLTWRLPDASVPRAFNDSVAGCPVHGAAIYRHGTYPWKLDFKQPFKVTCPIGGEVYPSNDFLRYYRSGYQDKSALGGDYSDDGWGWTPRGGERHWLVAYANHWFWSRYNIPGALNLSRAYLLTGDRRYAHQAAAMLARIADIYPDMDHEFQSRYGSLSPGYSGKILNHIWETGVIQNLAETYDNIWDAIDGDTELQRLRGQSGEQIRDLIERNLLEEGIDNILSGHIQGNFGMHQNAMAVLVAVRQTAPSREVLAEILDRTGAEGRYEGIKYALYNWIHRDGVPFETSPGYNFGWVANLVETAELLERAGVDLFAEPQFRRLLQWPLDITVNGTNTPALGDAGDTRHGLGFGNFNVYRAAFQRFGGADYAWAFEKSGGLTRSYATYDSLFAESSQEKLKAARAEQPRPAKPSRVLDGYGMVLLNNPAETVGLMNYYGWRGGHSHRDGLTFDLYAWGKALTPDTGYPDFMNDKVPGIYSWSKATIAHNTVTVDAKQQTGNLGGTVRRFARSPWVQYSDVEAPGNYPGIREYRRALLLVSTDEQHAYAVDIFRVAGGSQHDYSLHGAIGARSVVSGQFGPVQKKGTLAGEDVEVGEFFDDPVLAAADYQGGYSRYIGSGFQHFINPQWQADSGPAVVEVVPELDPKVRLRIHLVPQAGQKAVLAEAQVSPVKNPQLLPYLIARRSGDDLASTFATVLDPFQEQAVVQSVEKLATSDDAVALRVTHAGGVDVILQAREGGPTRAAGELLSSDAALVVARFAADGSFRNAAAVGGTQLRVGDRVFPLTPAATGEVTAVDLAANTITVRWQGAAPAPDGLVGRTIHLGNDRRSNLLTITAARADGEAQVLTADASLIAGRGRVTGLDEKECALRSDTSFLFSALYPGMWAVDEQQAEFRPILSVSRGAFQLAPGPTLAEQFTDRDGSGKTEFWISAAGPGDTLRLEQLTQVP